jgi:tetratricopeptide (TPR) repeat protein
MERRILALGMRLVFLLVLACLFFSCNDGPANKLLSSPPYAVLTDSIRKEPRHAELYYRRGQLLYSNGEWAAAKTDLRAAWRLQPREDIGLSLTTALRHESDDSAFVFLQRARQELPESLALAIGLARSYQKKERYAEALELCANILKSIPNQLDALLLQSELEAAQGNDAQSLQTLETAYSYAPSDAELLQDLCFRYATIGNIRALALSDSLIARDRAAAHAEPYYFKGVYYRAKKQPAEATHWLDEAIRHDYNFLDAYMEKGELQYEQKQFAAAQKTFVLALRVSPTFADAYQWLAKCQEAQGNKAEAKTNYERAYGLDKTNVEAKQAAERL